jgi:hypothetical protein
MPSIGTQTPTVIRRCIVGVEVCNGRLTTQRVPLRTGDDKPTRLARHRQSKQVGTSKYFTHPQSRMKGEPRPTTVRIAQSTIQI